MRSAGKVITSGELRLRSRIGIQSGLVSHKEVRQMQDESVDRAVFYSRLEPGGLVVSEMERRTKEMDDAREALCSSIHQFVEKAKSAEKDLKSVSGKIRDANDKLSASIMKFMGTTNSADFGKTVQQAVTLVDALERLAALQDSGKLANVISAMNSKEQK